MPSRLHFTSRAVRSVPSWWLTALFVMPSAAAMSQTQSSRTASAEIMRILVPSPRTLKKPATVSSAAPSCIFSRTSATAPSCTTFSEQLYSPFAMP